MLQVLGCVQLICWCRLLMRAAGSALLVDAD
jgi:hypothetical protein